jgi:hypothetical protein
MERSFKLTPTGDKSPSFAFQYPFGVVTPKTPEDLALMDTNKDGVVDAKDDPFGPFYPGDSFVDWVGLSIYTYGSTFPWSDNVISPPGKFELYFNNGNFYSTFAQGKNKPMMISETGAAFHVNTPKGPGVGEVETKRSWWRQYITNSTWLNAHPLVKGICLFEFQKYEEGMFLIPVYTINFFLTLTVIGIVYEDGTPSLRDFRHSVKADVRAAFIEDFNTVKTLYELEVNTFKNPQGRRNTGYDMKWSGLLGLAVVLALSFVNF